MSVHALQIVSDCGELSIALVCRAVAGADCRMRPPIGDDREEWDVGDRGLVDGPCWAIEWVEATSIADGLMFADGDGVVLAADVDVNYDEGVMVTLAAPQTPLPALSGGLCLECGCDCQNPEHEVPAEVCS